MKESDLYLPVKKYLVAQGYEVKGEVGDCDVVAIREKEEPVVIELKLNLNLTVLLQAADRLSVSSKVYIGVPHQNSVLKRNSKRVIKLLRMLGFGLLAVNLSREEYNVTVLLDPGEYQPRISKRKKERLLGEFEKRLGDPNLGGLTKRKGVMTAYRQRAIAIATYLKEHGPTKASDIAKNLGDTKARNLLYKDVYGWFDRIGRGIYQISPRGEAELVTWGNEISH